ncbi:MAG: hypothetical protein HY763_11825 [Planctomycetes bacterium]|nr:hypothetical protein [Planctomycetota bacterium]
MLTCPAAPIRGDDSVRAALESAAVHLSQGNPTAALSELATVERLEPENPWLWYYRGSARIALHRPREAVAALDRAERILRNLGDPDPALRRRVREVRALARRQVMAFTLSAGVGYDSNVAYLGSAPTLGSISGRGDGDFRSGFATDVLLLADDRRRMSAGLRVDGAWQFEVESFDEHNFGGNLCLEYALAERWTATLRYDYEFTRLGHNSFLSQHALTTGLSYAWRARDALWQPSDSRWYYRVLTADYLYSTPPVFDQDATAHAVGFEQEFLLRPVRAWPWTWSLRAGYEVENVEAQGPEFDRLAHAVRLGMALPLIRPGQPERYLLLPDKELTLSGDVEWRVEDYRNYSRIDRTRDRRYDDVTTVTLVLSQTLIDDAQRGRLVLHAVGAYSSADSTVEVRGNRSPFTYEKYVFGVQIQWSF